jgi:uncharacterized protein YbcV (DUF1398 family)
MFTKDQIEAAHQKVQSGADFPAYVEEIKQLGVKSHEVVLTDGNWIFKGANDWVVQFHSGLAPVDVSTEASPAYFQEILAKHQKGESDFPTFCRQAGEAGVERWISDFEQMHVTYVGSNGAVIKVEAIPH